MSTPPKLTEADIRNWAGEQSLAKGRPYFRDGLIINPRRQGDMLKAQCVGSASQPYRVELTLGDKGIVTGHCSCPVGDGGRCKHAAALLLAWLNDPAAFAEVDALRTTLDKQSKEALIALMMKMLDRYPDLEALVELSTLSPTQANKPLEAKVIARQVNNLFKQLADEDDYGSAYEVADKAKDIKQLGDNYATVGDWRNAVTVYQTVAEGILDQYEMFGEADQNGDLAEVVNECVAGLGEALIAVQEAPLREAILHTLFDIEQWDTDFGGIDMGYAAMDFILQQATTAEKRLVAQWVRAVMPKAEAGISNYRRQTYGGLLLSLEAETIDDETFLRICRESGRLPDLVDRLLNLHRVEEALSEVKNVSDYELLNMEASFTTHGQFDLFARLITARGQTSQDRRIKEWLKADAAKRGDVGATLQFAEEMFWAMPSLPGYQEVKNLAQQTKQWATLQPPLMEKIATEPRYQNLLISIYLEEGEIDQALKCLQTPSKPPIYGYFAPMIHLTVAKAAEATRPRAALEIYLKEIKRLIAERSRSSYSSAAGYLSQVRALYQRLGEENNWRTLITNLRQEHKSLRALQDELNKAKL